MKNQANYTATRWRAMKDTVVSLKSQIDFLLKLPPHIARSILLYRQEKYYPVDEIKKDKPVA